MCRAMHLHDEGKYDLAIELYDKTIGKKIEIFKQSKQYQSMSVNQFLSYNDMMLMIENRALSMIELLKDLVKQKKYQEVCSKVDKFVDSSVYLGTQHLYIRKMQLLHAESLCGIGSHHSSLSLHIDLLQLSTDLQGPDHIETAEVRNYLPIPFHTCMYLRSVFLDLHSYCLFML